MYSLGLRHTVWVGLGLGAACLMYLGLVKEVLPETLATQFDFQGNPNGYQAKDSFYTLFPGIIIFTNLLLAAVSTKLLQKIPDSLVNFPWKKYWFSNNELKLKAHGKFKDIIGYTLIYTNLVILMSFDIIVNANGVVPIIAVEFNHFLYIIMGMSVFLFVGIFVSFKPPS